MPSKLKILHLNQKGNYFLLSTVIFLIMMVLTVGIVEFGRVMMVRNQLQTASDAAALAAAGSDENVTKWVRLVVTTDRGMHTVCNKKTCWCSACGTISINVTGLEEELLDRGQWQDFCVPPCDCGGDDCTVRITDRWVTMKTATLHSGADEEDIEQAVSAILESTRIALSYRAYQDQEHVYATLKRAGSLEEIQSLLTLNTSWISHYSDVNCAVYWDEQNPESYNSCVSTGYHDWQEMQAGSDHVARMIAAKNKLVSLQKAPATAGVSREYIGEVIHDYLSANISGAWSADFDVYDQRGSPYYPSVVVHAAKDIPVLMRDFISMPLLLDPDAAYLFGDDGIVTTVETCSQGDTHYIDPSLTQYSQYGELTALPEDRYYVRKPEDACRE